jgi:hypothetical protein
MIAFFSNLASRLLPKPPKPAVRVSEEDVTLLEGDRTRERFAWGEVREVVTFKRDCGIYDDIRLAFRIDDDDWIEVSEEAEGWSDLTAAVERHFPSVPTDWYWTVMLPPFETRYRVLYERA